MQQPIAATQPRRRLGPRTAAAIGYAIILIVLFHRLLAGGVLSPGAIIGAMEPFHTKQYDVDLYRNLIEFDVWSQMVPWQFEQYQHQGGIPLWNPSIYCGFPIYANGQSELLNPTHWIYYFVNPDLARGPMAALRLWLSAMVMFILLRRYRIGPMAAFLGGAVWILSSFNIRWLLWPHTDSSLVLPLLVLALDGFLDRPTGRRWALVSLAGLLLLLSGHPGTQLMVGIVAGIFVLARAAAQRAEGCGWPTLALRVLGCAAAGVVALLAAMAVILPFIGQILGSFEWVQANRGAWVLPMQTLWLFITPNILGWPRGAHGYIGPIEYNDVCCWFGLVALGLALAAAVTWCGEEFRISNFEFRIWKTKLHSHRDFPPQGLQQKPELAKSDSDIFPIRNPKSEIRNSSPPRWVGGFAILLVLVSLPLAFGAAQYLPLIRHGPLGDLTSFNRMFLGLHFGGAILAAIGADQVLGPRPRPTTRLAFLFMLAALACGLFLLCHGQQIQFLRVAGRQTWALFWLDSSVRVAGGLLIGILACALLGVMAWTSRSGQPAAMPWRIALALAVVADLLWVAWGLNPIPPRELVEPPLPPGIQKVIASADGARIVATDFLLAPNLATVYGFRDVRGYDLPRPYHLGRLLNALRLGKTPWTLLPKERMAPVMDPALANWLNRCSVRYLITPVPTNAIPVGRPAAHTAGPPSLHSSSVSLAPSPSVPKAGSSDQPWPLVEQLTRCCVYANPNAYPRAFIPVEAGPGNEAQALQALLDPAVDLREKTIYEEATHPARAMRLPKAASGSVRITADLDEEVALDVRTPTGGLVVLGDRANPGWSVTVDGAPAVPLTVNYLFRGVASPPGRHAIRWSYRPRGLMTGSIISALALFFLGWLLIRGSLEFPANG